LSITDFADNDIFVDGGGFFFNDFYSFADPGTPADAVLSNIVLEVFFRLNGNSCENEIAMRLTDPAGNTQLVNAFPACNGGSGLFSATFNVPSGNTIGAPANWELRFDDTNDQNPDFEYSVRFGRLTYDAQYTACVPVEVLQQPDNSLARSLTPSPIKVFPVPASEQLNIEYFSQGSGSMAMQILSSEGKLMMSQEGIIQEGFNMIQMNIADLPAGHYYIRVSDAHNAQVKSFVKINM